MAVAARVKRLFLTHHDPVHDDLFLDDIESRAREMAASLNSPLQVSCAREGYHSRFENDTPAQFPDLRSATLGASLRVLVVDDDEDLRMLVRLVMQRGGHVVLEAPDGEQGLLILEREQPDLVLLDLNMPGIGGFEVLQRLRAQEQFRRLPVVVLTTRGNEESIHISFRLGATDFLAKPFSPPQLDARARACFAHSLSEQ
jgi:CheY-like chemotaxis protein